MKPPRSATPKRSLKARALQWLAQREQSRSELRRKLMPHAVAEFAALANADVEGVNPGPRAIEESHPSETPASRVESVLDWLEGHKYLSNERFAESRVHARSSRFGNLRIRQELQQHQVALSADVARTLASTELQRACEVRARKFDRMPVDVAERMKQARFLAARGFSPDTIGRALRTNLRRDEDCDSADPVPD